MLEADQPLTLKSCKIWLIHTVFLANHRQIHRSSVRNRSSSADDLLSVAVAKSATQCTTTKKTILKPLSKNLTK